MFFREAEDNVINALNLTVEAPIKRIEVVSITEYKGAGLLGKGSIFNHHIINFAIDDLISSSSLLASQSAKVPGKVQISINIINNHHYHLWKHLGPYQEYQSCLS